MPDYVFLMVFHVAGGGKFPCLVLVGDRKGGETEKNLSPDQMVGRSGES